MAEFSDVLDPGEDTTILDVGGTAFNWSLFDIPGSITLVNLHQPGAGQRQSPRPFSLMRADGTRLPFRDRSFDIGYSNSVIEHLFTFDQQRCFAEEMRRASGALWIQTPARSFPIEPHYLAPLVHFLPKRWQRRLLRNFTVWGLLTRPSQREVDGLVEEIRLVTYREMQELFPDCEIRREKFLLLTKSYTAVRAAPPEGGAVAADS